MCLCLVCLCIGPVNINDLANPVKIMESAVVNNGHQVRETVYYQKNSEILASFGITFGISWVSSPFDLVAASSFQFAPAITTLSPIYKNEGFVTSQIDLDTYLA